MFPCTNLDKYGATIGEVCDNDEALRVIKDDCGRQLIARVLAEKLIAARAELAALRERVKVLEPRPLREGDEYIRDDNRWSIRRWCAQSSVNEHRVYERLVYVPVAAASAPEKDPAEWEPQRAYEIGDTFMYKGRLCRIVLEPPPCEPEKAEPSIVRRVFDAEGERQLSGLDETMRGLPEKAGPVKPPFRPKDRVRHAKYGDGTVNFICDLSGNERAEVRFDDWRFPILVPLDAIATAPTPEPGEKHWLGSGKPPTRRTLEELQTEAAERQTGRLTDKVKHLERKIQAQRAEIHRLRERERMANEAVRRKGAMDEFAALDKELRGDPEPAIAPFELRDAPLHPDRPGFAQRLSRIEESVARIEARQLVAHRPWTLHSGPCYCVDCETMRRKIGEVKP